MWNYLKLNIKKEKNSDL